MAGLVRPYTTGGDITFSSALVSVDSSITFGGATGTVTFTSCTLADGGTVTITGSSNVAIAGPFPLGTASASTLELISVANAGDLTFTGASSGTGTLRPLSNLNFGSHNLVLGTNANPVGVEYLDYTFTSNGAGTVTLGSTAVTADAL